MAESNWNTFELPGCQPPFIEGCILGGKIKLSKHLYDSSQAIHFSGAYSNNDSLHIKVMCSPHKINMDGINAWMDAKSPNLMKIYGACNINGHDVEFSQGLYGSTLAGIQKPLGHGELRKMAKGIANGLLGLHKSGFAHCDISPVNIIKTSEDWKIIDTGSLQKIGTKITNKPRKSLFQAPETFSSEYIVKENQDYYSLAMCLAYGSGVFHSNRKDQVLFISKFLKCSIYPMHYEFCKRIDEQLFRFCLCMLTEKDNRGNQIQARQIRDCKPVFLSNKLEYSIPVLQSRLEDKVYELVSCLGSAGLNLISPELRLYYQENNPIVLRNHLSNIIKVLNNNTTGKASEEFISNITRATIRQALSSIIISNMPDFNHFRTIPNSIEEVLPVGSYYCIEKKEFDIFCNLINEQNQIRAEKRRKQVERVGKISKAVVLGTLGVILGIIALALTIGFSALG